MDQASYLKRKRKYIFFLSLLTSTLFLCFVCLIALSPNFLSGKTYILAGFVLILISIVLTTGYGSWANKSKKALDLESKS